MDKNSEEWRHECEIRQWCKMIRQNWGGMRWFYDGPRKRMIKYRGKAAVKKLTSEIIEALNNGV